MAHSAAPFLGLCESFGQVRVAERKRCTTQRTHSQQRQYGEVSVTAEGERGMRIYVVIYASSLPEL